MSRSLVRAVIVATNDAGEAVVVASAAVNVYRKGTTDLPVFYGGPSGGGVLSNPLISDAAGRIILWLDRTEVTTVDLHVTDNSGAAVAAGTSIPVAFSPFTMFGSGSPDGVQADLALLTALAVISSNDSVDDHIIVTQAEYDAITPPRPAKTVYDIVG